MSRRLEPILMALGAVIVALSAGSARATTIQDLVRIKGHERNTLIGLGIVVGLDGTGDSSGESLVAARPFEQLLANLGNPIERIEELDDADSYALVEVTMELPATGIRSGDLRDVTVHVLYNATSLAGGQLVMSPLRVPLPDAADLMPLAFAGGAIVIEGDNPRSGLVRQGGQMIADVRANPVTSAGFVTLVLKDQYAGYPVATTIARSINSEFAIERTRIAVAEDAKNVLIRVPDADRVNPSEFLAELMLTPVDPSLIQTRARIVINERRGIILVTGDVQIGPVIITHEGLSITSITPEPVPSAQRPTVEASRWAGVDTTAAREHNATRLADLLRAFDQLNVPVRDQIAIVHELKKTGKLHAEIVTE